MNILNILTKLNTLSEAFSKCNLALRLGVWAVVWVLTGILLILFAKDFFASLGAILILITIVMFFGSSFAMLMGWLDDEL